MMGGGEEAGALSTPKMGGTTAGGEEKGEEKGEASGGSTTYFEDIIISVGGRGVEEKLCFIGKFSLSND
jgi:hypothetical protein